MAFPRWAILGPVAIAAAGLAFAGYKAKPWSPRAPDTYPARLTSEKVTIAIDPLWNDRLAGAVFDKPDIVTRGIMPAGVIVFNDNDFPVVVEGATAELINGEDRIRTLEAGETAIRLFRKGDKAWDPLPLPRLPGGGRSPFPSRDVTKDALEDFEHKFLGHKIVAAHEKGGGYLYLHVPTKDLRAYLAKSRLYIPDIQRHDTGQSLIFFEIELGPVLAGAAGAP